MVVAGFSLRVVADLSAGFYISLFSKDGNQSGVK